MRYLKLIISLILALVVVVAVIWFGLIILLISIVIAPFAIWWTKKKLRVNESVEKTTTKSDVRQSTSKTSYKVIEAEYEIIDKSK